MVENDPLVSVIMNCFNGEKYLQKAIDSVYAQTYHNWEIIFWDNASVDNSSVIANNYNNKLRYFYSDKLAPLYEARNYAIDQCRGSVICFLDCDDVWVKKKLEKQVYMYTSGNPIVYARFQFIDSVGERLFIDSPKPYAGTIYHHLLRNNPVSISSALLDATILKEEKFDNTYNLLGDFELWVRLSLRYNFVYVDDVLEFSRQHRDCTSLVHKQKWIIEQRYFYSRCLRSKKTRKIIGVFAILRYAIRSEMISFVMFVKEVVSYRN